MVNDFMVCVDRIIASACFEPVAERERLLRDDDVGTNGGVAQLEKGFNKNIVSEDEVGFINNDEKNREVGCCSKIIRECRICQEEDEEHEMEAPCACNGTLKFAHRKCIQKWCNKKGDITCEICNQIFSPNYVLPPAKSNSDVMAIDISYGTGAIMAVPAHDTRDHEFALKYCIPVRGFIKSNEGSCSDFRKLFVGEGTSINSSSSISGLDINGLPSKEAASKVIEWVEETGNRNRKE